MHKSVRRENGDEFGVPREYPQPEAVQERPATLASSEFTPVVGRSVSTRRVDVVEQHGRRRREAVLPTLVVVRGCLVRVVAVDVEQVDRAGFDLVDRCVEGGADQPGVDHVVVVVDPARHELEHVVVEPCMFVTFPRVDGDDFAVDAVVADRIAECEERTAVMRAEFDDPTRLLVPDEVVGEPAVSGPRGSSSRSVECVGAERR